MVKISVITPSFGQARFLPHTLASVRAQDHGEVEHIVVDPGSTDGSREIAAAAPGVTLIAEPDRGQSDGITKGFRRASGDVLAWLNSDDLYPDPGVLSAVAAAFAGHPRADVVYGRVDFVDEDGAFLRHGYVNPRPERLSASLPFEVGLVQPGIFLRRRVFEALGGPSDAYDYCMDYDYWARMVLAGHRWHFLDRTLAHHRWWDGMKTSAGREESLREHVRVCIDHFGYVHWRWIERLAQYRVTGQDGIVSTAPAGDGPALDAARDRVIAETVTAAQRRALQAADDQERRDTLDYLEGRREALLRGRLPGGGTKRPLYAPAGEWLRRRAPGAFRKLRALRRAFPPGG